MTLIGSVNAEIDLALGYDTFGIRRFIETDDPLQLLDGFYLDDDPRETGGDPAEFRVRFGLDIGATADFVVGAVSAFGGIFAELGLNLRDTDGDGRVRGSEFAEAAGARPVLHPRSRRRARASRAFLEVRLGPPNPAPNLSFGLPIVPDTVIVDFDIDLCGPQPEPQLATLESDGTLRLNVGSRAAERGVSVDEIAEAYSVTGVDNGVVAVTAFGITQTYGDDGPVKVRTDHWRLRIRRRRIQSFGGTCGKPTDARWG